LAGRYPQEFVESVRGAADIVQFISDYVPLKPAGARFKGLCPFHQEKTPSFSVDPKLQLYHCFGCSTGGDLFSFVMNYESVGFTEALEIAAKRFGVKLPESGAPAPSGPDPYKRTLALNEAAESFFQARLRDPKGAARCGSYLEKRRLDAETIEKLGLGFAVAEWEALRTHLLANDRFRDRLIFIIKDVTGRTIAFGGRALDGETEPKYINSPETPAYKKGEHLYGLHLAREAIRREGFAVVVEGYMDLAALVQAGVENVVASLGTAFTPNQARLLKRFSDRAVFSYDGDSAGAKATARSLDLLLENDFEVRVVDLPAGQDPDDYIGEHGPEAYGQLLRQAPPYLEFLIRKAAENVDRNDPGAKAAAVNLVLPHVAKLGSGIARGEWASRLADSLGIEDALVLQELRSAVKDARASIRRRPTLRPFDKLRAQGRPGPQGHADPSTGSGQASSEQAFTRPPSEAENLLVVELLRAGDRCEKWIDDLEQIELQESCIRPIVDAIVRLTRDGLEITHTSVHDALADQPARDLLTRIAFRDVPEEGPGVDDCLWTFKQQHMKREANKMRRDIREQQRGTTSTEELDQQLLQLQKLARERDASIKCEER